MIITTYDLMTGHPFLAGMTSQQLERLAPWGHRAIFHVGARIFSEGGKADRFWLVREGQVALQTYVPGRGNVTIETLGSGAVLGWSWLFPPYRWQMGAIAVAQTLAIEMNGDGVRHMCAEDPEIGSELYRRFIQVVVDRLQATRKRFLDLCQD